MLWVSVQNEDRLVIFNPQGRPLPFSPLLMGKDSTGADVRITAPGSLILSKAGEVLALCETPSGSRVLRFTREGQPLPGWELPFRASTMTIDSQGRLYVVEAYRRRWHIFTDAGEKVAGPFAPRPSDRLSLEAPVLYHGIAIAADEQRVYVGSPTLRRVDVYDREETAEGGPPAFRFLEKPLCAIGPFPGGIDRAPDGRLFVSDSDHLVRIFSADGSEHLGDLYSDFPPLRAPQGVAFLPDGSGLFVAAHGGGHAPSHLLVFRQPALPVADDAPKTTEADIEVDGNANAEIFPVDEYPSDAEPADLETVDDPKP
jgi:sugar lactone lactonase YvrE